MKDWIDDGAKQVAISMYCDQESYALDKPVSCFANLAGGKGILANVYVVLRLPDDSVRYLVRTESGVALRESQEAFLSDWQIAPLQSSDRLEFNPAELGQQGAITLYAWLATAGDAIGDSNAWLSNLSSFDMQIGEESGPASGSAGVGGTEGCVVATVANRPGDAGAVQLLRDFRDLYLLGSSAGRWLVNEYYEYSPAVAGWLMHRETAKALVRLSLVPLVGLAWLLLEASMTAQLLVFALMGVILVARVRRAVVLRRGRQPNPLGA